MSGLYRHRPVTVWARQVVATDWDTCAAIADWMSGHLVELDAYLRHQGPGHVIATDGPLYAEDQDWVIRYPDGHFRVLPPDTFAATFEPVVHLL